MSRLSREDAINRNHSIKVSPDHTVVQCRGLAFVRVEFIFIRAYHSVRKYTESLGIDMVISIFTSINI